MVVFTHRPAISRTYVALLMATAGYVSSRTIVLVWMGVGFRARLGRGIGKNDVVLGPEVESPALSL